MSDRLNNTINITGLLACIGVVILKAFMGIIDWGYITATLFILYITIKEL